MGYSPQSRKRVGQDLMTEQPQIIQSHVKNHDHAETKKKGNLNI